MFIVRSRVQGKSLVLRIHPTKVFVPNLMSWLGATQMAVRRGESFCDVGTGSGLHAILAAKLGARCVFGTDIDEEVLRFAQANARLNGVGRICRFFKGSLVEPLVDRNIRVDAMIYNAPHFPGRCVDARLPSRLKDSVNGGHDGSGLNARFLFEAPAALSENGRIYDPVVGWSKPSEAWRAIRACGYRFHEVARTDIPVWGRGNHTREKLIERPGVHDFSYRYPRGRDTAARILELRIDELPPVARRKPLPVRVDFRIGRKD
ncbi:MAG: 50S ribosomal protein L11 methyltransferase [Elusimicrobiota bacterium]|jgi:SAM-dependent methyltransferase